eukprot:scaffold236_cov245-Amphora_coffeaeformis.AAC.5
MMTADSSTPAPAPSPAPAVAWSDDFPSSVEEAGALLGMAITKLSVNSASTHKAPPTGMHSSFTVRTEVPTTELFMRLYQIRTLLQQPTDDNKPLVAAPSILAVLMKLLTLSSSMAPSYLHYNEALNTTQQRPETPPLLSEALRHLWVDAVALCHVQGDRLTGAAKIPTTQFLRQMLSLAGLNPRSQKAAGGVRVAALQVVRALFHQMPARMAPWSLDVLQMCQKALRSAGNGEPSYRVAALEAAIATATACRTAHVQKTNEESLVLAGAYEEKALVEITRILRVAATDKFPEVRRSAAVLCAIAVPLSISSAGGGDAALRALEEWLPVCTKNLDDASAFVSQSWAQALARGLCTVLEYHLARGGGGSGSGGGGEDADIGETRASPGGAGGQAQARNKVSWLAQLRSTRAILAYLCQQFVRAGGELGATRLGGPFSMGGRGVRLGWSLAMVEFLRHVHTVKGVEINPKEWRKQLLRELLSSELEKQLKPPENKGNTNPLFATAAQRNWSKADGPLVRTLVSRIFRQGLTEGVAEPVQIGLLDDWVSSLDAHHQSASSPGSEEAKTKGAFDSGKQLNANQLQVALVEISHLIASLGEAVSSKVEDILKAVRQLLEHTDTGVRFEAAVACTALVNNFPPVGSTIFPDLILEIQIHHSELMRLATSGDSQSDEPEQKQTGLRMFRKRENKVDSSAPHQHAIHGKSTLISLLLRDMPQNGAGLSKELVSLVIPVTEVLVSCQFNDVLTQAFPAAACMCVRAGYSLISGIMTTGPGGVAPHTPVIFEAWNKCQQAAKKGGKHLAPRHDLFCVDALLVSVVVFLKHCSELLLSIPEALTQVSVVLEELLPLLTSNGRLAIIPSTPPVAAKLESARASLLEAFAWLPSGSFPMAADNVFAFAAEQIKVAVDSEVSCSILQELVNEEDSLLDVKTVSRASKEAHSGGARDLAMSLIALESEAVHPAEQESVMHLISHPRFSLLGEGSAFQDSHILGVFAKKSSSGKAPTPLHEVGAWRKPIDPCCSSKVRLIDAAIQAFSATFGLKSGKEQQSAMDMLESLVPPYYAQLARAIGVNSALTEQDRRSKNKEDSAAMTNITAVLLSCLQSLPLHESTHNVPISLGPPWMNKAKDLLLTLLPSGSNDIRRAAAEGLALLATLGVSEDAHFLQSKVLHSLDEVMQGNRPDAKVLRALPMESVAAARAGSLLTLACIQRTASHILLRHLERARIRSGSLSPAKATKKSNSELPILQMITRILPSINYFGFRDYLVVRCYAIHAFAVLLAYSERLEGDELGGVERQLLEKAIELVEDNFCSSWMLASIDVDRGEEPEKMAAETSLLSVLLRLMVFLAKHLHKVDTSEGGLTRRFALIGRIILEKHRLHPYIVREVMALFEVLAPSLSISAPQSKAYSQEEMLRQTFSCATPGTSDASLYGSAPWDEASLLSFGSARATLFAELNLALIRHEGAPLNCQPSIVAGRCMSLLERASASRYFDGARVFRSLAASARAERRFFESSVIRQETPKFLLSLVASDTVSDDLCVRWILFARAVLSGPRSAPGGDIDDMHYSIEQVSRKAFDVAETDVAAVVKAGNPSRTDVKAIAAQMLSLALQQLLTNQEITENGISKSVQFNYFEAKKACQLQLKDCKSRNAPLPDSRLVFHLQEMVTTICMSSNAALDHSELYSVQEASIYVLAKLIECFSQMDDPEVPDTKLLEQYAQQIFSSIKHALSAAEENSSESAIRVFHAGCKALCSIVENELTTDAAVVKRLARSIVSSVNEAPFVKISDGKELFEAGKVNLTEAKFICEVWVTGQLFFKADDQSTKDYIVQVRKDLLTSVAGLSSQFALIAMEGARLLASKSLTLVGRRGEINSAIAGNGGIFATCDDDMSSIAKILIVRSWSSCCRSAICCLTEILEAETNEGTLTGAEQWLEAMACLAIEGAENALVGLEVEGKAEYGLNSSDILAECLSGLLLLVQRKPDLLSRVKGRLENLLHSLCKSVVVPYLAVTESKKDVRAVQTASKLLEALAGSDIRMSQAAFITTLLTPLQFLESGKMDRNSKPAMILLRTSLTGMASVVSRSEVQSSFVQSILALVLGHVFHTDKPFPEAISEAAKKLFVECFRHKTTSNRERGKLAMDLVASNEWDAWAVAFMADDGAATFGSLEKACSVLTDNTSPHQLQALAAIKAMAQSSPPPNEIVAGIMHIAGSSVIEIFYAYGAGKAPDASKSQEVCVGAMKVILISFMQLVSTGAADADFAAFLGVIFGVFLAVVRYNGFPNHPSPQPGGHPTIGRLCAQAILHVAKTAPIPFKTCVAMLAPHDRTLLEFAVRGEMTGYQVQGGTQEKKKLNLKNFKK